MKRISAILLIFCLLLAAFPTAALADEEQIINLVTDSSQVERGGTWHNSTAVPNYDGGPHLRADEDGAYCQVNLKDLRPGTYEVFYWKAMYQEFSSPAMKFTLFHNGSTTSTASVNLREGESEWVSLGVYQFSGKGDEFLRHTTVGADGNSRLTAVKLVPTTKAVTPDTATDGGAPSPAPGGQVDNTAYPNEQTFPVSDTVGTWTTSTAVPNYDGGPHVWSNDPSSSFQIRITPAKAGNYKVYYWKPVHENSSNAMELMLKHNGKEELAGTLDLKSGSTGWVLLGVYDFAANQDEFLSNTPKTGNSRATGVKIVPTNEAVSTPGTTVSPKPSAAVSPAPTPVNREPSQFELKNDHVYYMFRADSFQEHLGSWRIETSATADSFAPAILNGLQTNVPGTQDAQAALRVPKNGMYYAWAHTRDYPDRAGTRYFSIHVDGAAFPNSTGVHGTGNWEWELAGALPLFKGDHTLGLTDTSGNYARCDFLILTDDPDFQPPWEPEILTDWYENRRYDAASVVLQPDTADPDRPNDEIAVKFNGNYLSFDVPPILRNDRTLVPMRAIFEALGCDVSWNDETQTATGSRNGKKVSVTIDSTRAYVDGHAITIDQPAILMDDRTLIPLRFVSEAYDCLVLWQEETQTVEIMAAEVKRSYFLRPESFIDAGSWIIESNEGCLNGSTLRGMIPQARADGKATTAEDADPTLSRPAIAKVEISQPGTYLLWVHHRDYKSNQPGTRFFNVAMDGVQAEPTFGQHGADGWLWTKAGTYQLDAGTHEISLLDTSGFFARCDGLFLTEDLSLTPPTSYSGLLSIAKPLDVLDGLPPVNFPEWAQADFAPSREAALENDKVKVVFYQGESGKGSLVQNEIYIKDAAGQWVLVKDKTEPLGYLMLRADSSQNIGYAEGNITVQQKMLVNGVTTDSLNKNFYKMGVPVWFVPSGFEQTGENQITLTFPEAQADVQVVWELDSLYPDPKVTINAAFREAGAYSFLLSEGGEYSADQIESIMAPFRYTQKRLPSDAVVLPEHYLFTPMATFTLPADNAKVPGKNLTTGIVIEPTWIPRGWVYQETSRFGVVLVGPDGSYRPQFTAPLFGTDGCRFAAGDSYSVSFRVINQLTPWFDTYKYVTQDLFGLHDYRSNYYTSLNEAIYNTTELIMDDDYGGWDPIGKAQWNMEGQNFSSSANPMEMVQRYLLTGDPEILRQRAVPTIANLLTRGLLHFKWEDYLDRGTIYLGKDKWPTPIGTPITAYNAGVYAGLYAMSQGRMPALLDIGLTKEPLFANNIPAFSNDLNKYLYTHDQKDLESAIKTADAYLESDVYGAKKAATMPPFGSFANLDYYANFGSLLQLYEITGDQKYLDAAEVSARLLATTTWVPGIQGDYGTTDYTIDPAQTLARPFMAGHDFWWHGDTQWRLGNDKGEAKPPAEGNTPLQEETVPGWLPTRVGLGLEQASTFGEGLNIYMNAWAGDMVRLSVYTGDPYFQTLAKNAIVGRFGNYAGYYQNRYITHQMKPEYPYTGPDLTSIYWHHIPPFLAILENFLVNETWAVSQQNISFPSLRQEGYSYFYSNQFGHAPGTFYGQDDMWLWLDDGVVHPDSVQINYLCARKDGVLGIALMNEAQEDVTTTVALGEKVPGGAGYTGKAALYEADGTQLEIDVVNGAFTVTIPAKGIRSLVLDGIGVTKPHYVIDNYTTSTELGQTVSTHDRGKGYVIQFDDERYFAYVYLTDLKKDTQKVKLDYKVGTESFTQETDQYPFEFIVEVDDVTKPFTYSFTVTRADGTTQQIQGGTLAPLH